MGGFLGEKIKKRRKELFLKQKDLAGEDFTTSFISQIEKGKLNPSLKTLEILARRLEVPVAYLLEEERESVVTVDSDTVNHLIGLFAKFEGDVSSSDYAGALEVIGKLKSKMQELGIDTYCFLCDYYAARVYFGISKYEECANACREILQKLINYEMYDKLAVCLYMMGICFEKLSEYEQAKEHLSRCLETIEENDLSLYEIKAECLIKLGSIHGRQGAYVKAMEFYRQAFEISKRENCHRYIGDCYTGMGLCCYYLKDYRESLKHLGRALSLYRLIEYDYGVAMAQNNMGMVYIKQNNQDEALKCFTDSVRLYRKLSRPLSEARSLNELANIYIQRKEYKECLKYCRRVRNILRMNHDEIIMAHNLEILGKVLYGIGKKKWALKALKKAAGIFEKHDVMDSNLADTYSVMANVYMEIGENEAAKAMFNRSIKILSKSSEKPLETERGDILEHKI
ncbi:helix-turn-helix domain-containing protein [Biomaibacter acetigenes]|uniref:Helix-turn-helix domain-containing protein n=1 Tax=Biomaibacter acetigenes TaxID=2316383 RepID=A0A3G2R470_9FIRM|nr:helix-turn-helix transcriptional regulator [Biomaibacter acetigenes]AYO30314.1 helix-turn-helix domain-containing protein [Biomaibacter acetigenes]RKL62730.1 helix-turn-helix domain-containing protein [Thermoanaerobacteraceae bacterium SP2]